MDEPTFNTWIFSTLEENFEHYHQESLATMEQMGPLLARDLPDVAANAQQKSMSESLAPELRVDCMRALDWRVVECQDQLILPDCVALGYDKSGFATPLVFSDLDELNHVYLPICSHRMLVGSRDRETKVPANINAVAAGCSWDFFVARDRTPEFERLRNILRSQVSQLLDGLISDAVTSAV